MAPHRDYSHRDVLDKLGVKPGLQVAIDEQGVPLEPDLATRVRERVGDLVTSADEQVDLVLLTVDIGTDITACLQRWRARLTPAGGIWVLTPKRGQPGYFGQDDLILLGLAAGLVDNKVCSVSDTTSAMRFVIRRTDRPR